MADTSVYGAWQGSAGSSRPAFRLSAHGGLAARLGDALPTHRELATRVDAMGELEHLVAAILALDPQAARVLGRARTPLGEWFGQINDTNASVRVSAAGSLLVIELGPMTDFDRARRDASGECCTLPFPGGDIAWFTPQSGCVAEIGVPREAEADELVVLLGEGEPDVAGLKKALASRSLPESSCGALDVREGVVVVADSAVGCGELVRRGEESRAVEAVRMAALLNGGIQLSTDAIVGVATATALVVGRYEVSAGSTTAGARWCRLRRAIG